jgi:GTP-sensing pleiotropic transcriptional regulator CodY
MLNTKKMPTEYTQREKREESKESNVKKNQQNSVFGNED